MIASTFAAGLADAFVGDDAGRACQLLALVAAQPAERQGQLAAGLLAGDAGEGTTGGGEGGDEGTGGGGGGGAGWGNRLTNATCRALLTGTEAGGPVPSAVASAVCNWLHGWSPQAADPSSAQTSLYALRYVPVLVYLHLALGGGARTAKGGADMVALASVDACLQAIRAREDHRCEGLRRAGAGGAGPGTEPHGSAGAGPTLSLPVVSPNAPSAYYLDAMDGGGAGAATVWAHEARNGSLLGRSAARRAPADAGAAVQIALACFVDRLASMPAIAQLHFCDVCTVACVLRPFLPPGDEWLGEGVDAGGGGAGGGGGDGGGGGGGEGRRAATVRLVAPPGARPATSAGAHTLGTATMLELVRGVTFCASRAAASDAVRRTAQVVARALHARALEQLNERVLLATTACCALLATGGGE